MWLNRQRDDAQHQRTLAAMRTTFIALPGNRAIQLLARRYFKFLLGIAAALPAAICELIAEARHKATTAGSHLIRRNSFGVNFLLEACHFRRFSPVITADERTLIDGAAALSAAKRRRISTPTEFR